MAERPTATDSVMQIELEAARAKLAPERLQRLDVAYRLSAPQCLAVGKLLVECASAYGEAHQDDMDEDELEEYVDALRLHAVALLLDGGQAWRLGVSDSTTLGPGGPRATGKDHPPLVDFSKCLEQWETDGAQLLEPLELTLPWPEVRAREVALLLAEEALLEARALGCESESLTWLASILREARAVQDSSDALVFAKLAEESEQLYQRACATQSAAEAAAAAAAEDRSLNERAYQSRFAALVIGIARAALQRSPDIGKIFKDGFSSGRLGLSYPRYALAYELDRYCSWAEAGADEIFGAYEHEEVNRAGAALERLLQAAIERARIVAEAPRAVSDD